MHNVFNRRGYGQAAKRRHGGASPFNVGVTIALVTTMVALLATSAMLSAFLPEWVPLDAAGAARQAHVLAAYWAFAIVAVHVGLRWPMIMAIARRSFGITRPSRVRTGALQLVTLGIAVCGVWSWSALQLGTRLTNQVSLDWWNFDEGVLGFFLYCTAAAGLLVAAGHYAARLLRAVWPGSGAAMAQRLHQQG